MGVHHSWQVKDEDKKKSKFKSTIVSFSVRGYSKGHINLNSGQTSILEQTQYPKFHQVVRNCNASQTAGEKLCICGKNVIWRSKQNSLCGPYVLMLNRVSRCLKQNVTVNIFNNS